MNTAKQHFFDALLTARSEGKTGRFFVYTDTLTNRPAEIDILNGEIAAVRYAGQTEAVALERLLEKNITRTLFMQTIAIPVRDATHTPTIDDVLQRLAEDEAHHNFQLAQELLSEAEYLFSEVFGRGASRKVRELAAAYPPDQNPIEFLERCQGEVAETFGLDLTRKVFNPLVEKAKKAQSVGL